MHCRRYVVEGIVQGVFYRAGTQHTARRLGLTGWVCNRPDGAVELVACGDEAKLKRLEKWLWQGPPQARVQRVEASVIASQSFSRFDIR